MISPTDKTGKTLATGETGSTARRGRKGKLNSGGRFSDLLQSQAAGHAPATRTAAATGTRASQVSMAAAMSSATPAQSAGLSTQSIAPPVPPADLPWIFSAPAIEKHMNQWFMEMTRQQNEVRMLIYNNAVEGWKNTNARNRELGLPEVPPPPPPELAEVAPMPEGYWSRTPGENS